MNNYSRPGKKRAGEQVQGLKVVILTLISIFAVLTGWVYLAGLSAERTVFSSSYYHDLSNETDLTSALHEELQKTLPDIIIQNMTKELESEIEGNLTDQQQIMMHAAIRFVTEALAEVFDEEWFEEHMLLITDDILASVKGEQDELSATIDLQDGKEAVRNKVITALKSLPDDLRNQLNIPENQIENIVDDILDEVDFKEQIQLADLLDQYDEGLSADLNNTISTIQTGRVIYQYIPYIIFVLLFMSCFLLAGFSGSLKWFGAATLIFSSTFLIGVRLFHTLLDPVILFKSASGLSLSPETANAVADYTVASVSIIPIISAAVGFLLLITGVIIGKANQKLSLH